MPATSAIDAKDRIISGGVSATARRRGAANRGAIPWEDGDYGYRRKHHLP